MHKGEDLAMYIREKSRCKDGVHCRCFSIVESIRLSPARTVQRQVLYPGEINNSQKAAWTRAIEVITGEAESRQAALFPDDREAPELSFESIQTCVDAMELHRPRQWGACWLALTIWKHPGLDGFQKERLPASRQGTCWLDVLKVQACCRLIDPGSECRLYRRWHENSAMGGLLGLDPVIPKDAFCRVLDRPEPHRRGFFAFLKERWGTLSGARHEVFPYDLTSPCFESDAPFAGKHQSGYSRDKRPGCAQVVIALIVTPDGFPVACEVLPGNASDKAPLLDFMRRIEAQHGRSERVWVMDRGIPTEETLEAMRADPS
ncbi:MAG: IS1634 family transposase, partial [Gammaproteobacteria bacterium]|nr:IS1634 family transposase [Gammaproteobacteria bacterium]